jgi:hypothetical protein
VFNANNACKAIESYVLLQENDRRGHGFEGDNAARRPHGPGRHERVQPDVGADIIDEIAGTNEASEQFNLLSVDLLSRAFLGVQVARFRPEEEAKPVAC